MMKNSDWTTFRAISATMVFCACSAGGAKNMNNVSPSMAPAQTMPAMTNELRIDLEPPAQFIIATSRTHDGALPLMAKYFQDAGPVASEHGFSARGRLNVVEVKAGSFEPNNFVGLYSFPSADNAKRFEADHRWPAIKAQRPKVWSDLRLSAFTIRTPVVLRFDKDKIYEVRYEWWKGEGPSVTDATVREGKLVGDFVDGHHEMLPADVRGPSRIRLIEWPDLATAKAHSPSAGSYDRLDSLYAKAAVD